MPVTLSKRSSMPSGLRRRLIVRDFSERRSYPPLGMTGTRKIQDVFVDCKLVGQARRGRFIAGRTADCLGSRHGP